MSCAQSSPMRPGEDVRSAHVVVCCWMGFCIHGLQCSCGCCSWLRMLVLASDKWLRRSGVFPSFGFLFPYEWSLGILAL